MGLDNIHVTVWKCLEEKGISWLTKLLNEIMGPRKCGTSGEGVG